MANSTKLVWSERPRAWRHESAPMNGDVQRLLLDIEEENDRLENELASPSLACMTEYAIARESGDPTLRRISPSAERLHISIRELTADSVAAAYPLDLGFSAEVVAVRKSLFRLADANAGQIDPDACLVGIIRLLVLRGAIVRTARRPRRVIPVHGLVASVRGLLAG